MLLPQLVEAKEEVGEEVLAMVEPEVMTGHVQIVFVKIIQPTCIGICTKKPPELQATNVVDRRRTLVS